MNRSILSLVGIGFLAVIGLILFGGSFYTVDQGERAVILRYGKITDTAEPGLGFKLPIIDSAVAISVQGHAQQYNDFQVYSKDQQPATLVLSVNYRIPSDKVADVYANYGSTEGVIARILDRKVFEQVKNVFGQYNAVTAIQQRAKLNMEAEAAVKEAIVASHGPIIVESLQIENIDFSDAYEASVEARMLAQVEVEKIQQNAARERVTAEITVTKANAAADAVRAEAQAQADAIRVKGQAEADAIKAKSAALQQSPQLIELTKAERWNGQLPTTVLPNGTIPFIDAAPAAK